MRLAALACALLVALAFARTAAPAGAHDQPSPAVARHWHGKVPKARAEEYERYIAEAIKKFTTLHGSRGYQLFREDDGDVVHFSVISYWDSLDDIHGYAGADIRKVRPLPRDPEFLIDPEPTVRNYLVRASVQR